LPRKKPQFAELSAKQKRFCEEYLVDMNGTQAAIRAGYAPKAARIQAVQVLSIEKVQNYLQKLKNEQSKRTGITADLVLKELAAVGFSKITDVLDIDDEDVPLKKNISNKAKSAIQAITSNKKRTEFGVDRTISVKMHNKIGALEKLGTHFGLFNDLNGALATLTQYGDVEAGEDGSYVFKPSGSGKAEIPIGEDEVSAEE
jgi:phage terminase small subunit